MQYIYNSSTSSYRELIPGHLFYSYVNFTIITRGPDSPKRSPDLLYNVKIGPDQLWLSLIMIHILFFAILVK